MQIRTSASLLVAAFAVAVASCTPEDAGTSSVAETTTTSSTTTTSLAPLATPSSTLVAGLDGEIVAARTAELDELIAEVQSLRGLPFLVPLRVSLDTSAGLLDRLDQELGVVTPFVDLDRRLFELLGLLDSGADLERIYRSAFVVAVPAFYDTVNAELVVDGERTEWDAYDRSLVMHELVHALTDQHFRHGAIARSLRDGGARDSLTAYTSLVEGDATYFQLVYLQELGPEAQLAAAEAAQAAATSLSAATPRFLAADLAFPFDRGAVFVERLVAGGGIAAVDRAYEDPPSSTEQILHPERYQGLEASRSPAAQVDVEIDGYDALPIVAFGEWNLTLLLQDALSIGTLAQTVDGWRGDALRLFDNGTDLALAYVFVGESDEDAIEVAQAILSHARDTMQLGEGYDLAGGVQFDVGGFLFIDRIGDGLRLVIADDPEAGVALRRIVRVP